MILTYKKNLDNTSRDKLSLLGWDSSYKKNDFKILFDDYSKIDKETLWANLQYFLEKVIPVAEEDVSIINISSMNAFTPLTKISPYLGV